MMLKVEKFWAQRGWQCRVAVGVCGLMIGGCDLIDPCASRWDSIQIGDTRESVLEKLGPPKWQRGLKLPLLSGEEAVWEGLSGKRCTAYFAFDHLVGKALASR